MVRSIRLNVVLPEESTSWAVRESPLGSAGATMGLASGAASITTDGAESTATGAGAGGTVADRRGNPVVVTVDLLITGSGLSECFNEGSGIDCSTGITAATVRGVRSLRASGASISCLGVRARVAIVPLTEDAPDTARWAHATKTAAASAIRSVRWVFRRRERLLVGSFARGSASRGSGVRCGCAARTGATTRLGSTAACGSGRRRACTRGACGALRGSGAGVPS